MPKLIGRVPGILDEDTQPLYDRLAYVSGTTTTLRFFTAPQAGAKTLVDTNMTLAGELPQPQSFRCYAIGLILGDGATATEEMNYLDVMSLLHEASFRLHVGEKDKIVGNGIFFPGGVGVAPVCTGAVATLQAGQSGVADPRAMFTLSKPVPIGVSINFFVELQWPAGAVTLVRGNCKIMVVLHGELTRGVY